MAVKLLRSDTAHKRPNPAVMAEGQLAINYESGSPGLFFKDNNGALIKVGPVHIGTIAPNANPPAGGTTGNSVAELWLDTAATPNQLKVWNGTDWVSTLPDEIPVSKLADGAARQLLQTAANGTDVEWTSNVDLPGTLDVTGVATFDNNVKIPDGTAAAPSFHFTSDTNTGFYRQGSDAFGVVTNGTEKVRFDATGAPLKEVANGTFYPVVTEVDLGYAANQVPINAYLGALAFMDEVPRLRPSATAPQQNQDINIEYVSNTSIKIRMRGTDGVVRSTTLTLS